MIDDYSEAAWTVIESYFKGQHLKRLVRHQIESYNDFVNFQIKKTIGMFNPVRIRSDQDYDAKLKKHKLELVITFDNFRIYRPQIHENNGATKLMFPQEARLRNFTYASNMTVDINIKYVIRTGIMLENIHITYHEYNHPNYKQKGNQFIPQLSILDLLFNENENSKKYF